MTLALSPHLPACLKPRSRRSHCSPLPQEIISSLKQATVRAGGTSSTSQPSPPSIPCRSHSTCESYPLPGVPLAKSTQPSAASAIPASISAFSPPKKPPMSAFSTACPLKPSFNFISSITSFPSSAGSNSVSVYISPSPLYLCARSASSLSTLDALFLPARFSFFITHTRTLASRYRAKRLLWRRYILQDCAR